MLMKSRVLVPLIVQGFDAKVVVSMVGVIIQGVGYGGLSFQEQQQHTTIIIRLMMTLK